MFLLFDIQTGVAGDMILGALFDLGLDFSAWKNQIQSLNLPDMRLEINKVSKHGIMATQFHAYFPHEHVHRGIKEIQVIVNASSLSNGVKEKAMEVFFKLAQVEAKIHGVPIDQVHFHELGALDSIVDIVGACLGFEMLGIQNFLTTSFTFGTGTVNTQHGLMAEPVPATLALSTGFPSIRTQLSGELCTPTGMALVTTFAKPMPKNWKGSLIKQGYGAGSRNLPDTANVLRICQMEDCESIGESGSLFQIECNLDNMSPELIGYAAERLLAAGCNDVWQEAIIMKKTRAAVKLCALVEEDLLNSVLALVAAETTTGGVRFYPVRRFVAEKSKASITTKYGDIDLKGVQFPGTTAIRFTPEYESCRQLALAAKVPLPEVYREAMLAATRLERHEKAPTGLDV